jgi:uncharacterized protein YjiS (DUF1127 family)
MKMYDTIIASYAKKSILSTVFSKIARSYHRKKVARQTYNELSRLTDRELRDLGIQRSDIYDIAYGDFR